MRCIFFSIFLTALSIIFSCSKKVYYSKEVTNWQSAPTPDSSLLYYTVYLIGDAGDPVLTGEEPTFKILRSQLEADSLSSLVFLGDNIYDFGLPEKDALGRPLSEKKIDAQLDIVRNYKGKVFFISGNHDWARMNEEGLLAVRRQEEYIEQKLNRGNTFVPNQGCPGPYKISVHNNVILIALDSQWWLHNHDKPYGNSSDCSAEDESDVIAQLQDFVEANQNKNIVVVAHHPLYSNGNHGGYYSFMDYVFPLRLVSTKLYIPLPVLGALYPLHRKFGGTSQDIVSYKYQKYKRSILEVLAQHKHLVYAAGHDHNLQFHRADSLYHIVSGSGSKVSPVKKGAGATFTKHSKGFAKLKYYTNGQTWVEYWTPSADNETPELAFRHKVYEKRSSLPDLSCGLSNVDYKDSTVTISAARTFKRSRVGKWILGEHYRSEWITPVIVNMFDLKREKGGLIPYGKGGGKQSLSLKLRDTANHEFNLRSVRKNLSKAIPADYLNTFLADLAKDQVSAQHPYGALAVASLAESAGLLHTNPQLVVVPEDSCLGPYKQEFKNMLAFFEENPDENHENTASLGFAKNIVGTDKVLSELQEDHDAQVDAHAYAKARLFDMLIGDWDRHERQFRWVEQKGNKQKLYLPIPEDRDQAFFRFDGLLPWLVSRKWAVPNFQDFNFTFKDLAGLNATAKYIDRRFLSTLSSSDWELIGQSLKARITDEAIERAVRQLPQEIYPFHGAEIISKLKARRDELPEAAREYYQLLSKYVDVYGSQKKEFFKVKRLSETKTEVIVLKLRKSGQIKDTLYARLFDHSVTKEIRLYGLGGQDKFQIEGKVRKSLLVRIIGGADRDSVTDQSLVQGLAKKTVVYDLNKGNFLQTTSETNKELSPNTSVYDLSQDKFNYNSLAPQFRLSYNIDDGLLIGAGFVFKKYKFRSQPYSAQHRVIITMATATGSKRLDYDLNIKKVFPGIDFHTRARAYLPAFFTNYYGYGNESRFNRNAIADPSMNVQLRHVHFNPSLNKNVTRFFTVGIGPKYEYYQLQQLVTSDADMLDQAAALFKPYHYLGLKGFFLIGAVDNASNPTRGIVLSAEANFQKELATAEKYSQYLSEFKFYISPNLPFQLTFAGRIGVGLNSGTYRFYQANTLGTGEMFSNENNLRGFRKSRFIGDQCFYQNLEVRTELLKFNVYLFPGKLGILALTDNGKVWQRGSYSRLWHVSAGAGLWVNVFNKIIFAGTYTLSKEEGLLNFHLGYWF